tara:strand:- start:324 stop:674 length:351 start_codon:yes stop_codon:yes gene_type:complete
MLIVYGIKNCDKVKKLINELNNEEITFDFYDYKKKLPLVEHIKRWESFLGELPVNKRGTTYRKLKLSFESLDNCSKLDFIAQNASMIKRPIVELEEKVLVIGYNKESILNIKHKIS